MKDLPEVSVIIPTYNRKWFLVETLGSLAGQTFPASRFEVIVVDDGSTENTQEILAGNFPFQIRYIYQPNQGDAEARNHGVTKSHSDLLVFLDDDILVGPNYLEAIVSGHRDSQNRIIVGTEFLWLNDGNPLESNEQRIDSLDGEGDLQPIEFTRVCSNNMSIRKDGYLAIGFMQNLDFRGSSIWCDVDFTYRARGKGFEFYRSPEAVCWHRDYVARNLSNQNRRWKEAAYRAAALFQRHPDLIDYLPMFEDKTPVDWRRDPLSVVIRKIVRKAVSSKPAMWILEKAENILSGAGSMGGVLSHLHRWIVGGYIYQGYRNGLKDSMDG